MIAARRSLSVLSLALAVSAVSWAAPATDAFAHALYRSSVPAAGASLAKAPAAVTITFTEQPDPTISDIQILDSSGDQVSKEAAQPVPGQPLELSEALPALPKGVYTVNWRVVSKIDGHVTAGSFAFGIGQKPSSAATTAKQPPTPSPSVPLIASRWVLFLGLCILVGGGLVAPWVFGSVPTFGRELFAAGAVGSVLGIIGWVLSEARLVGVSLGSLLRSGQGHELIAIAVAILFTSALALVAFRSGARWFVIGSGVTACLTLYVFTLAGHADVSRSLRQYNVAVESVHLISVAVWIGGLAWLVVGLFPGPADRSARAAKRFSLLATVTIVVVAVSGFLRATSEVGSVHGLFHSSFGIALIVKGALFAVVAGLAIINHFRQVPKAESGTSSLRRTASTELVMAAGVIAAAVVVSQFAPPGYGPPSRGPAIQPIVLAGQDFATTVKAKLTVSPGTVGQNTFSATVSDYDTGLPIEATSVELRFTYPSDATVGGSELLLKKNGQNWQAAGSNLSLLGRWDVQMVVQEQTTSTDVPFQLTTKLPQEQVGVSQGNPTLYTVSLSDGNSLQMYLDHGQPGPDTVHFTFFQPSGSELAIRSATATALTPQGSLKHLKLIRFDKGHFASNVTLTAGRWTFLIDGVAGGTTYTGYMQQEI